MDAQHAVHVKQMATRKVVLYVNLSLMMTNRGVSSLRVLLQAMPLPGSCIKLTHICLMIGIQTSLMASQCTHSCSCAEQLTALASSPQHPGNLSSPLWQQAQDAKETHSFLLTLGLRGSPTVCTVWYSSSNITTGVLTVLAADGKLYNISERVVHSFAELCSKADVATLFH